MKPSSKRYRPTTECSDDTSFRTTSSTTELQPRRATSSAPRILLLDMDGTMIGKITPQVCEYEILLATEPKRLKNMRADLVERLRTGIIRPYLFDLCDLVKTGELTNVEIFVYTASESRWAHFLIPCIEEALHFRFNRPFFTRDNCVVVNMEYKKAFDIVAPIILRKLRKKYTGILFKTSDVINNTMLVDNNPTVLLKPSMDSKRTLKCPTYNFAYHYDVFCRIPVSVLHELFKSFISILAMNEIFPDLPPSDIEDVHHFLLLYNQRLYENTKYSWKEQKNTGKDRLFRVLINALRHNQNPKGRTSLGGITPEFVHYLSIDIEKAGMYSSPLRTSSSSSSMKGLPSLRRR